MSISFSNPDLKLIIFGGKGGTGKTTSAAASALHLHKLNPEKKILIMSIDPAHSLGDSLNMVIGNRIIPIMENVWGLEIDARRLYEDYLKKNGELIRRIMDRGTLFDEKDIEGFFVMSLPGLNEVMAIIKIANLLKTEEYDLIILDTAPTGHTLVFLSLPDYMEQFINILEMMEDRYHYILKALTGRDRRDRCDEFIASQRQDIKKVRKLLTNPVETEFVPVTSSELMSIREVEKLVQTLRRSKISVKSIVVNRIVEGGEKCPFCSDRRKEIERCMRQIEGKFEHYNLIKMPLFSHEIRGVKGLTEYARVLFGEEDYSFAPTEVKFLPEGFPLPEGKLSDLLEREKLDFVIFGGKGGVGKTTTAAANALYMAQHKPNKKILIFSTDPAPSLSDIFEQRIGGEVTKISGLNNLYAVEINGVQLLEDYNTQYQNEIDEAFGEPSGAGIRFDREILKALVSFSPPVFGEIMSLRKMMDLRKKGEYDLYIMDSAASGHLIRFLQLPHLVMDWLKTIFRLLLRCMGIARLDKTIERNLKLSKDIKNILRILSNSEKTEFVMVTIPEEMGVAEMEDLSYSIAELNIPSLHMIINMIVPLTGCSFCAVRRKNQQKYIGELMRRLEGQIIVSVPLFSHEVKGQENLSKLAEIMYEEQTIRKENLNMN
jgi:arsenite-transporting ATPase